MPNYCYNELEVKGKPEALNLFKEFADGSHEKLDFNNFIPYPQGYEKKLKSAQDSKDGYNGFGSTHIFSGYSWCNNNWGTKWNAWEVHLEATKDKLAYSFTTAWSPPIGVLEAMSRIFPTLRFKLHYCDPAMNMDGVVRAFKGELKFKEKKR